MVAMKLHIARFGLSFGAAVGVTTALAALTSVARFEFADVLFVPGMLAAALVFPQGAESNHAYSFLGLAGVITALLLTWPIMRLGQLFSRSRRS